MQPTSSKMLKGSTETIDRSGNGNSSESRRGAALAVVFIVMIVLSILAGAVYVLFASNVSSMNWTVDRISARFAAESGMRLAIHHLSLDLIPPAGTDPFFLPGDSAGWISIPGVDDMAFVVIDPYDLANRPFANTGVEIRSIGRSGEGIETVVARYVPNSPSRYALLVDESIPAGIFTDGRVIDGPVHCNGTIEFSSATPDSANDPFVQEISTTTEGGFYFSGSGYSESPHPEGSYTWVQPFSSHRRGSPSWNTDAQGIDFTRLHDYFDGLRSEAAGRGTLIYGVKRLLFDGDRILFKKGILSSTELIQLSPDSNLVFIENGGLPIYMRSNSGLTVPLTVISTGPVYISGMINANTSTNGGPLGIVSLRDIIIATDPSQSGSSDWPSPWNINTNGSLSVNAYLAAPSGKLRAESISYPPERVYFSVLGGVLERDVGRLGTAITGYELFIAYDEGLSGVRPPYFPILENWKIFSWDENPDFGEKSIEDNMY
ncbi:MAG: hypothetical protein KAT47_01605 [Candidatus Aegiribacteria sp.]|nr:hypothetical protein [Candidatus Aegiribacteria sp.]